MFPQVGEHISLGIRVSHVGEHISLGICVSQVGEHVSLGIRVSWKEEHKSLGICVSEVGEHISLGIRVSPGGGTHITGDMFVLDGLKKSFQCIFTKGLCSKGNFLICFKFIPSSPPSPPPKLARLDDPTATPTRTAKKAIDCLPFWCPKAMKGRPCWCPRPILWVLNSFLMQTLPFVAINLHRCWPRE